MSEKCHGNVHTRNAAHIHSSSIFRNNWKVENFVEDNDRGFGTLNKANSRNLFDFKERNAHVDSDTLKSFNC